MLIKVTQDHIDRGEKDNCLGCPVALALAEAIGEEINVQTDEFEGPDSGTIDLPDSVKLFVDSFDEGLPVHPFEFELSEDDVETLLSDCEPDDEDEE